MVIDTDSNYQGYLYPVGHATMIILVLPILVLHYCFIDMDPLFERALPYILLILRVTVGVAICNISKSYLGLVHVSGLRIFARFTCACTELIVVLHHTRQ